MPVGFQLLIAALVGGGLGWVIGWLMARSRTRLPMDNRLESELRAQLDQREKELSQARSESVHTKTALAAAQANHASAEKMLAEQRTLHDKNLTEARLAQEKALTDLREAFKALSADALKQSAPEFLRLAEQSFGKFQESAKGDLEKRHESIKVLVEPLKQQLDTYQKRLQQSEVNQADTLGKVKEQLTALAASSQSLATETAQFRAVLKSNQARGNWGEETLRRVVEAAGMSVHCDFSEQSHGETGKPDMIVRLPGERVIIVDAKVPDLAVLAAADAAEPAKRADLLEEHARKIRGAIKSLAERDYPKQFGNALDHVVLFLPAESLFSSALEGDPDLIVWAESKRVYLATPASFIAVLRTIDFLWQQHAQSANAQQIAEAAKDLYGRVVTFTKNLEEIGKGLDRANDAFNQATGSFQTRVRPAGERLAELGGGVPGKELPELKPVDTQPRLPFS